jgi:peptide-methionine (S)-S-oxide reductase
MLRKTVAALALVAAVALAVPAAAQNTSAPQPGLEIATFASGCFWCTESDFDKVAGVTETISGYIGGMTVKPTYQQVSAGRTGHAEAVQVTFDPKKVTYQQLLDHYWRNVDPLDNGGQFCDRGSQYRPAIFVHSPEQRKLAEESKAALDASKQFNRPIVVEITNATEFTPAEDYHQDYYKKEPLRYKIYRHGCGRDARLEALWGKPKS